MTGHKHPEPFSEEKKILYDIYDLRGLIDDWLKKRRIDSYIQSDRFGQGLGYSEGYFHPAFTSDCTAVISLDKEGSKPIIYFGKINQLYDKVMDKAMEKIRKKLGDRWTREHSRVLTFVMEKIMEELPDDIVDIGRSKKNIIIKKAMEKIRNKRGDPWTREHSRVLTFVMKKIMEELPGDITSFLRLPPLYAAIVKVDQLDGIQGTGYV